MRTKVTIELFKHVQNIQLMCFACVEDENWICDDVSTNIMKLGGEKNNDYDAALSESTSRRITSPSRTQLTSFLIPHHSTANKLNTAATTCCAFFPFIFA